MPSRTRRFFLNALSLTVTAFALRGVSVLFNIYVSNKAGSEAMGLFSLLGSIYGFAMTVAMSGINLGTTRLVSDALALGNALLRLADKFVAMLDCCELFGIFVAQDYQLIDTLGAMFSL